MVILVAALAPSALRPQTPEVPRTSRTSNNIAKNRGQRLFEIKCAACHGLDARGGERGPNIARASAARARPDNELFRIIHDGLPQKGMPAFGGLGEQRIRAIVGYLRFLQRKTAILAESGNPTQGQQLFFGKGRCSECHAASGYGSFLSTDLSDFASDHDANEVRHALLNLQEQDKPPQTAAQVTTNTGQRYSGMIRNENNSSLQIQDSDGDFYLLMKSDLCSIERSPGPSMPRTYQQELSAAEVEDLVSYIMHQTSSPVMQGTQSLERKETQLE